MKLNYYDLGMLAVALVLTGCEPPDQAQSGKASSTNVAARPTAKNSEAELNFVASAQEKLNQLDQQISELSAKTDLLKDEAKAEGIKALAALREQRAQLGLKFEELKTSSRETWKDAKTGFEAAMAHVEKAFQDVKAKLGG